MNKIEFEIVGYLPSGQSKLKFTNTIFDDIIITLGKVSFDEGILHYDYNVIEHSSDFVKKDLDQKVGDLIMQMLEDGIRDNDLVYTGGIDAAD